MWTTAANASHDWACIDVDDRVGPLQFVDIQLAL